ncbi:ribonuclease HII [Gaetbulibacter aestuarii]|uniref:Ribonuclease HII n=1 Tax=Gaetbulibacter aestuarii TaxID=1502358 RepID=A0ABW7MZQ1_9FLAO
MKFIYALLLIGFVVSCTSPNKTKTQLIDYIPENSFLVVESPNAAQFRSGLRNNDFIQNLSQVEAYKTLEKKLNFLTLLHADSPLLVCLSGKNKDSLAYTVITKLKGSGFKTDSLPNYSEESLKSNNQTITKSNYNDQVYFSTVTDSILVASTSKNIIESVFKNYPIDPELQKLHKATDKEKTSIILNLKSGLVQRMFVSDSLSADTFSDYLALDIDMNQDAIFLNGITLATDSTNLIRIFKNTIPQENTMADICPSNADGFLSMTFQNYDLLLNNLKKVRTVDATLSSEPLFKNISEVGVIYQDDQRAIVLNSLDVIATNDALVSEQNLVDTYRQTEIYNFSKGPIFSEAFSPFITHQKADYYCTLDQYFVFSDAMDLLQNIIANYQNKTTWSDREDFQNIESHLSNASSLLQVTKPELLKNILKSNNLDSDRDFSKYPATALQFIYDTDFAHVHAVIQKNKVKAAAHSVSEELNIKLDADVLMPPQFVTNHITNEKEIVVQDVNNNLYLISTNGNILWKKQLNGAIMGRIEQVDMYRNGKLQLAFVTKNRLYVIDRLGRDVAPFPGKFEDDITQPLAVFDYDNNKKYRLLVTQGRNVLMYNMDLKPVKGFNFNAADSYLLTKPEHFRVGSRDYIVLKTRDQMYILNRRGDIRVKPKNSFKYSKEPVYLYQNKFTTTSADGDLITIDTRGNTASEKLNLVVNHHLVTTSKTLVTLTENNLTIKGKTTALDYGNYSEPKIFYIDDKIYVTVTDLQAHKVYVFDSNSKLLPNFPVYGNAAIDLNNIDPDRHLEFTTKGDNDAVLVYQIN